VVALASTTLAAAIIERPGFGIRDTKPLTTDFGEGARIAAGKSLCRGLYSFLKVKMSGC